MGAGAFRTKKQAERRAFRFEGIKLFSEALREKLDIVCVFATEKALALYDDVFASYGGDLYEVADAVYEKLTDENAPQGVLTVAKAPSPEPKHTGLTIILDGVADPGNVGTVIRCADAFGAERVILGDGSADAFGQKTVRAAMGSLFRVPTERASLAETIEKLKNDGYTVYAAMLDRDSVRVDAVEKGGKLAFVIGNEGHGISDEVRGACDGSVIIPMRDDGAESLNAAVAASVIMWNIKEFDGGRNGQTTALLYLAFAALWRGKRERDVSYVKNRLARGNICIRRKTA